MAKQTIYNAGIYVRLSQEDMRAGESLSIENQKLILTKYVKEQGWNLIDIYVDDGYSGTDFERPGVQRLLDDAKVGKINLIICKDLSRFGRNYIQVGQYIDYLFPSYNIRFIALNDNVDTASKDSSAMDMMPIVNLFNEWHSSSTSRKIKAVIEANAKQGKYRASSCAYGYVKADNANHTPVVDHEAAEVVKRIFCLRSQGITIRHIADKLNAEHIPIPSDYKYAKLGKENPKFTRHLWCHDTLRTILHNPIYLGHTAMMRVTTVSYKNHRTVTKDESDWIVTRNTHEPIISQELWDKCREVDESASTGKRDKQGKLKPLSGLMYCCDCGYKMKAAGKNLSRYGVKYRKVFFNCNSYASYGKCACTTHYITQKEIDSIVVADIRSIAALVVEDEDSARKQFLTTKRQLDLHHDTEGQKKLCERKNRLTELEKLIPSIYEDKVLGKISEKVGLQLIEKYETEQEELTKLISESEANLDSAKQDEKDIDEFIRRMRKYADIQELTREVSMELIEYITVDEYSAERPRDIHIYYKLLDKPLKDKRKLFNDTKS